MYKGASILPGQKLEQLLYNMYITVDDIKNEISLYYPIDNRNGNKK